VAVAELILVRPMRDKIRREIEAIEPADAVESDHRADALAWVVSGAPLFRVSKPALPPKHLVGYFVVTDGKRLLLVDHKNAQLWLPPGGHVEADEHPRDTVTRELREELGLVPTHDIAAPIMITCDATVGLTAGHTDVCLWYVVRTEVASVIRHDEEEFNEVRWFDFADIPFERSNPSMRRLLAKLRPNQAPQLSADRSVPTLKFYERRFHVSKARFRQR
jgi:8-oxo-dGTP diphosphatase